MPYCCKSNSGKLSTGRKGHPTRSQNNKPSEEVNNDFGSNKIQPKTPNNTDTVKLNYLRQLRNPLLPRILITINGQIHHALIDTGASHNVIRASIIPDATSSKHSELLLGDELAKLTVSGPIITNFDLAGESMKANFYIAEKLRESIILGQEWLLEEEVTCDFRRKCIHFGRKRRRTAYFVHCRHPKQANSAPTLATTANGFPETQAENFQQLLEEFGDVFNEEGPPHVTSTVEHNISLTSDRPVYVRPYRYSQEKKKIINEQVQEMLARDVITPSTSPYNAPIIIAKKKDGRNRFCVDYRKLNAVTESEASTLPIIQETLSDLGTASIFTTLDLKSGYWQIPLINTSRRLTAFTTPDGASYEFKVMPFGLKNAPATFQKMMTRDVLAGYLHHFVIVYLDDIIIFSKTHEEHMYHLRLVLERLQQHNLICAMEKCRFACQELPFLGHQLTRDGTTPLSAHINQIQNLQVPKDRKELRSILGAINWLRDYIPHCAEIIAPLTDLLKEKNKYKINDNAIRALETIKDVVNKPLHLHRPDYSIPFIIQTDASERGMGAVLYQQDEKQRRIINYASAKFTPPEQRYHCNEQECLAVIWAIKRYRSFIDGNHFILRTDSRALTWLNQLKDVRTKLTRWSLLLQEFSFTIEHCPGRTNELPDLLSRYPEESKNINEPDMERILIPYYDTEPASETPTLNNINATTTMQAVLDAQLQDTYIQSQIRRWRQIEQTGPKNKRDRQFFNLYNAKEGPLRRQVNSNEYKVVVPTSMKERVTLQFHDDPNAGHPGAEETLRVMQGNYYFTNMRTFIRNYVASCLICATCKRGPTQEKAPLRPRQPTQPWEIVSVDLMGPYSITQNGHRFIVVATDLFSRWTEAKPLKITSTKNVCDFLENDVFRRYGYPRAIITDNGPQFTSTDFDKYLTNWGTQHYTTAIYRPRGNPVERRNQELKKGLRIHFRTNRSIDWDNALSTILFNLRGRRNAAIGMSPSEALFGCDPKRPGEWTIPVPPNNNNPTTRTNRINIAQSRQRKYQTRYADPRDTSAPTNFTFNNGDKVYTRRFASRDNFATLWDGPYQVLTSAGATIYWVDRGVGAPAKYHADDLRPAPSTAEIAQAPARGRPRNPPPVISQVDQSSKDETKVQNVQSPRP